MAWGFIPGSVPSTLASGSTLDSLSCLLSEECTGPPDTAPSSVSVAGRVTLSFVAVGDSHQSQGPLKTKRGG